MVDRNQLSTIFARLVRHACVLSMRPVPTHSGSGEGLPSMAFASVLQVARDHGFPEEAARALEAAPWGRISSDSAHCRTDSSWQRKKKRRADRPRRTLLMVARTARQILAQGRGKREERITSLAQARPPRSASPSCSPRCSRTWPRAPRCPARSRVWIIYPTPWP